MQKDTSKFWFRDIAMLFVTFAILYLGVSYFRPISNPDEGRYAEIPREMISSGDYITPRLNGLEYFYKPPLFYWFQVLSLKSFGINRTSIRLANTLMAVVGICLTYTAARSMYGRRAGIFSALILSSSILYYVIGSVVTLDMTVSVFMSAAMFSFIVAIKKSGIFKSILLSLFFVFCALAVMTKGIIGILIPSAVVFFYMIFSGRNTINKFFRSTSKSDVIAIVIGVVLFFVITIPWHVAVSLANPPTDSTVSIFTSNPQGQGFFWYYFIHEHLLRYIDASTSMRSQPFWFFIVIAPAGFIPWVLLLPRAIKNSINSDEDLRSTFLFMSIWIVFIVLFFSISSSKLVPYITAVYPAFALMVGVWASREWNNIEKSKINTEHVLITCVGFLAAITIVVAYLILCKKDIEEDVKIAGFYGAIISCILMIVVSVFALYFLRARKMRKFWISAFVGASIFSASININAGMAQKINSEKIACKIKEIVADKPLAIAFNYGAFHDLPVWLDKTLMFVGDPPEEQQFGWQRKKHLQSYRIFSTSEALKKELKKNDIFVVLQQDDIDKFKSFKLPISLEEIARNKNIIVLKISLNEKK